MSEFTEQNPLRLIELFAGIGSQTQALKNIGIPHKVVGISEIDKYAIMSYEALHGKVHNFGDIRTIQALPKADLWTYSFPCQDISVAGKGAGIHEGTRSGLLLEVERLLTTANKDGTLPKYLLLENVKNSKPTLNVGFICYLRLGIRTIGRYSMQKTTAYRRTGKECSVYPYEANISLSSFPKSRDLNFVFGI